jgi:hypothetical protein
VVEGLPRLLLVFDADGIAEVVVARWFDANPAKLMELCMDNPHAAFVRSVLERTAFPSQDHKFYELGDGKRGGIVVWGLTRRDALMWYQGGGLEG